MKKESYNTILEHLLFHKALISEGNERINEYIEMLKNLEEGAYLTIGNPIDKSIIIVFELATKHKLDPWDINLVEFSKMYLKRIRKEEDINFVIAGQIVLMAWSILKLQSEELLTQAETKEEEYYFDDWDINGICGIYEEPQDLDYTTMVLKSEETPIQQRITRTGKRRITLMDLVHAFDEARREAQRQILLKEKRKKLLFKPPSFHDKVHKENLQHDIRVTWQRICKCDGNIVSLPNIYNGDIDDRVRTFMSILFLAQMKKIKIWQNSLPYGKILIKNLVPEKERTIKIKIPTLQNISEKDTSATPVQDLAVV